MDTKLEDLFEEEISKKEEKEKKKLEKFRKQEEKKKRKVEKKLEKKENKEFKKNNFDEEEVNITNLTPVTRTERREFEETRELMKELEVLRKKPIKEKKPNFLAEVLLGLAFVGLFVFSLDYVAYCYFKKPELLIQSALLCTTSITFIFTLTTKKEGVKKFFAFLTCLAFIGLMLYQILSV